MIEKKQVASSRGDRQFRRWVVLCLALALMVSLLVLNRWMLTDLGVRSYGRVWQYHVSYFDFGFVRRSLVGTIVSSLFRCGWNEYVCAYFIHGVAVFLFAGVVFWFVIRQGFKMGRLSVAALFLSPAMIIHCGYSTGALDVFVLLVFFTAGLLVRGWFGFICLTALGILVHEVYFFLVPAQLMAFHFRRCPGAKLCCRENGLFLFLTALAVFLVSKYAVLAVGKGDFEAAMRSALPNAAGFHPFWSGYFELSESARGNMEGSVKFFEQLSAGWFFLFLPFSYLMLLAWRNIVWQRPVLSGLLFVVGVFPLFAIFVATDVYRWVALSADSFLMMHLVLVRRGVVKGDFGWLDGAILSFFFVAPFGAAELARPFPMQQFFVEKFLRFGGF